MNFYLSQRAERRILLPHNAMHKLNLCRRAVSVCLSVRHVRVLCRNKQTYPQTFSPFYFFSHQTLMQYSDRDPLTGRRIQVGHEKWRFSTNISLYLRNGTR